MDFRLVQPCPACPFRRDCLRGWLGQARAEEIAESVEGGKTFPCHKTTRAGGAKRGTCSAMCAGAALVVQRTSTPHALLQIAERFGLYNPARLRGARLVFRSWAAFVGHHTHRAR